MGADDDMIVLTFLLADPQFSIDWEAGVARYSMTLEAVERWIPHLQAANAGLVPVRQLEVRGGDG